MVIKIGEMNRARGFAADDLDDARMGVAERIDGNAAKKIEILFARGVENIRSLPMRHDHRLPLVGGQQEFLCVLETRVCPGARPGKFLGLSCRLRSGTSFRRVVHQVTVKAASAAESEWPRTSVPGTEATSSGWEASNNASGVVPPTMRTWRTPPSMARLAASSFRTMPPQTTRRCTRRSISWQPTTERTFSPSSTPATSVR